MASQDYISEAETAIVDTIVDIHAITSAYQHEVNNLSNDGKPLEANKEYWASLHTHILILEKELSNLVELMEGL